MKAVLFVIACLIAAALAAPLSTEQKQFLFTKFVTQYNKQYETVEVLNRYNIFSSNIEKIVAHNAVNADLKLGVNQFADLSSEEFRSMLKLQAPKSKATMPCGSKAPVHKASSPNQENIDWRKAGDYVAPVQNQGQCGSCWAFSAVAPFESAWAIKTKKLVKLSEQQLVDCAGSHGNEGCNGGLMTTAYDYYIENGGACSADEYGYTARDGSCKKCSPVAKISGYKVVNGKDLVNAIAVNPVSIAVAASGFAFQFYSSGVIKDGSCSDKNLDHGVVVVGYANKSGSDPDHYIIRNSWGGSWGEQGHFRAQANVDCLGIESDEYNSYPVV